MEEEGTTETQTAGMSMSVAERDDIGDIEDDNDNAEIKENKDDREDITDKDYPADTDEEEESSIKDPDSKASRERQMWEQVAQQREESYGSKMKGEDITEEEMEIGDITTTPKMLKVKKSEKPQVISGKQTLSKPIATPRSTPTGTLLKAPEEMTIEPLEEKAGMTMKEAELQEMLYQPGLWLEDLDDVYKKLDKFIHLRRIRKRMPDGDEEEARFMAKVTETVARVGMYHANLQLRRSLQMTSKPMKSTPMKRGATPGGGAMSPEEAELKDFLCNPSKWGENLGTVYTRVERWSCL